MAKQPTSEESNTFIYIVLGLIVAIIGIFAIIRSRPAKIDPRAPALAQCLTEKGTHFYGAFWCEHCAKQKAAFGDAATKLPYVECFENGGTEQAVACKSKNIQGYPTWINASGERLEGEQTFEALAKFSGCTLQ